MGDHGPTIPTAILVTTQGRAEVHPAAEDWFEKVEVLRYASQRGQLFCPDCGERLKYYSEVRTPHFRHLRDTQGCTNEDRYPDRASRRREKWFRNSLVISFRQAFPPGTRFLADDYLGSQAPFFVVQLPSGKSLILNVITEKPDMQVWERRRKEFAAKGLPVFHVFGRGRVKSAIQRAEIGCTRIVIDDGLNADHLDAARPLLIDITYVAKEGFYGLPLLKGTPATLYFYEPAESPNVPGTLTILRGLMPNTSDTVYHGVAVKAEAAGQGAGRLRFGLRHGFYTTDDLTVQVWLRDGWRRRRKQGQAGLPSPAVARKHPLRIRWEQKATALVAEQERILAEQAKIQADAMARKIQHEQKHAEQLAALRAANQRDANLDGHGKEIFKDLLRLLTLEGARVLGGRIFPLRHPEAFAVPQAEWQAAILGFAYRARVAFWDDQAAHWLRRHRYGRWSDGRQDTQNARTDLRAFWRGLESAGLVTIVVNRWGDLEITPVKVPGSFQWPVTIRSDAAKTLALCVVCATGYDQPRCRLTDKWRYHDPANKLCLCVEHAKS